MTNMNVPPDTSSAPTLICRGCGLELPQAEFRLRRKGGNKRENQCRSCHASKMRRWRHERKLRRMEQFASAAKWRVDYSYLNRAASELVRGFGGHEAFAKEYVKLYRTCSRNKKSAKVAGDLLLAIVNLLRIVEPQEG